jgi:hypothetical protein
MVSLTGLSCAACGVAAATTVTGGALWDWAACADQEREFSRMAAMPNKTQETAEMMRIDERRKVASENGLIAMLIRTHRSR